MIGLFDSGLGGLTILRAIQHRLPHYSYLYYGDNKSAPYGDKSQADIFGLTKSGVDYLFQHGCPLVILACNTASAAALRRLQQDWLPANFPDRRILGIIVPTIEQITGLTWTNNGLSSKNSTVGIIGTAATINSHTYRNEIIKRAPNLKVIESSCPKLAPLIEQEAADKIIKQTIKTCTLKLYTKFNKQIDHLLLGCTHYEIIDENIFQQVLPLNTKIYHQPSIVAASLANYLERHQSMVDRLVKTGKSVYLTTGESAQVSAKATRYFGQSIQFASSDNSYTI